LNPGLLDSILRKLPKSTNANVLVGYDTSDDAAVYRLSNDLALVQTVDFLTPVADDPFMYGRIAAANSLSDIYAMGGQPISALSILAYPSSGDFEVLEQILRGGLATMAEANCAVVGGHSIADEEIKFGYAVTGLIHPDKIWKNVGARPGDLLVLTKALGSGVISTTLKRDGAQEPWVIAGTQTIASLNRLAADVLRQFDGVEGTLSPVHAATDVTGFGLIGHAKEMASGSGVSLRIDHREIEYLPGAIEAARGMFVSAGLKNNREFAQDYVRFAPSVSEDFRALLFDPQTSGGLLASLAPESASRAVEVLTQRGVSAHIIGEVLSKQPALIEIF
jgi:selenide, water dikinase